MNENPQHAQCVLRLSSEQKSRWTETAMYGYMKFTNIPMYRSTDGQLGHINSLK